MGQGHGDEKRSEEDERRQLEEESLHLRRDPPAASEPAKPKPVAPIPARKRKQQSGAKPTRPPVAKKVAKKVPKAPVKRPPEADASPVVPPVVKPPPTFKPTPPEEEPAGGGKEAEKGKPKDELPKVGSSTARSVLARIEMRSGKLPRVALQDVPSEPTPLVLTSARTVPTKRSLDHYDIVGEIGRGGVGIILKGRDVDLGRDVAIKILREEMADRSDLAHRFIEEAQISGQLQHPGIAPLYELGIHPDGRPYFAMKLIKGRTLAGLLNDRSDFRKGRHRFIQIFDKMCQAMAYVHSRGVIHRDIKPSNIMVGAFGEVQVMDWGFAKVLGRGGIDDERSARRLQSVVSIIETVRSSGESIGSQSLAGSLMGTPQYMPPEQATGDVDAVDARSDVFALGAVLCEILTGKPPYIPDPADPDVAQIIRDAARAQLAPARQRLDECGADAELIRICKECLVPAPAARPADAGVLAKEISSYLAEVEERARRSQLVAVEERGKAETARAEAKAAAAVAEEERRARRIMLSLGSAVVLTVLLGAGGFLVLQNKAKAREAQTARSVSLALEEAARLRGLAKADTSGDLSHWTAALAAAGQAREFAASEGTGDLLARADAMLETIEGEAAEAEAEVAQAARDKTMVARLEEIRAHKGDDFSPARLASEYEGAFHEYGIDVADGDLDAIAQQVAASSIAQDLIAALDEWAWVSAYQTRAGAEPSRPSAIAQRADENGWRRRLRTAIQRDDRARLTSLADTADVAALDATSVHLLASAVGNAGDPDAAVRLLAQAQRHHPKDLWVSFYLGYWLTKTTPPRWNQAARAYAAAVAIRPQLPSTWNNLGIALQSIEEHDDAKRAYQRALELRPGYAAALNNLGTLYAERDEHEEALRWFREAVAAQPDHALAWYGIAATLLKQGDRNGAIEAYKKALAYRPDLGEAHAAIVFLLGAEGRGREVLDAAQQALDDNPNAAWAHRNYALALWNLRQAEKALEHYARAVELDPTDALTVHDYGIALGRTGSWEAAIEQLEAACKAAPDSPIYRSDLGWAREQSGDVEGAMADFKQAVAMDPELDEAHDQLAALQVRTNDIEGAITSYVNAVNANPARVPYASQLGTLLGIHRTAGEAEEIFDTRIEDPQGPGRLDFQLQLSVARLNTAGDVEGARQALATAVAMAPEHPVLREQEGRLFSALGDHEAAEAAYRRSIQLDAERPIAYCLRGFALQKLGRFVEARDAIKKGHELGTEQIWPEPSDTWLEQAEHYVALHKDLDAYLGGSSKPEDTDEWIAVARVSRWSGRWDGAAHSYLEALSNTELEKGVRFSLLYEGAQAAARAGTEKPGQGVPEDEAARKAMREQARGWLREALEIASENMSPAQLRAALRAWERDPDLAATRTAIGLESGEREAWAALWAEIATKTKTDD